MLFAKKNGNLNVENFPVGAGRSPLAVLHIRASDIERMLLIESGNASHEYSETVAAFQEKAGSSSVC